MFVVAIFPVVSNTVITVLLLASVLVTTSSLSPLISYFKVSVPTIVIVGEFSAAYPIPVTDVMPVAEFTSKVKAPFTAVTSCSPVVLTKVTVVSVLPAAGATVMLLVIVPVKAFKSTVESFAGVTLPIVALPVKVTLASSAVVILV